MRIVMVFRLSAPAQLTLDNMGFATPEGLDLESCYSDLRDRRARVRDDGHFESAGFVRPQRLEDNVASILIYQRKGDKYTEAVYDVHSDQLTEQEYNPVYFKQAIVEFKKALMVAYMSGVSDKSAVRNTLEGIVNEWGMEATPLRLSSDRLRDIAHRFKALAMTIDHIELDEDGTRKVKFDVDPARGADSRVQVLYEGQGDVAQIKIIVPYENMGYWVRIYPDGLLALDDDNLPLDKVQAYAYHVIRQLYPGMEA